MASKGLMVTNGELIGNYIHWGGIIGQQPIYIGG